MTAIFRDTEGNLLPTPKPRTMAAIRKAYGGNAAIRTPADKDWQAMRAIRYMEAIRGIETPHSANDHYRYNVAGRLVAFDTASDGSRRVRYVREQEVPHWDFVATVTEIHAAPPMAAQGAFA